MHHAGLVATRLIVHALVALLVVAGCAGGDDGDPAPTTTEQSGVTEPPPGTSAETGIVMRDGVFGFSPDGTMSYEAIIVSSDAGSDVLVGALNRAGARFMLVTEDGTEHESDGGVERSGLFSPNYVAEPQVLSDGVRLYVDCKGVIEPAMAMTFRHILREELVEAGVADASVRPDFT